MRLRGLVALVVVLLLPAPGVAKKKASKPAPVPAETPSPLAFPDPPFVERYVSDPKPRTAEAAIFAAFKPVLASVTASRPVESGGNSQGSAFVVHPSGLLITNNHVVSGASDIAVRFSDGESLPARLAGADPSLDLAVLRVDVAKPLPASVLGNSDRVEEGDPLLALGCPFGMSATITRGILSGKERRVDVGALGAAGSPIAWLQTDAAINPGSSGGPLVDYDGSVIGVITATVPAGRGVAFAIPVNVVKKALPEMLRNAGAGRVFLGLTLGPVTSSGAEIISVRPGGPGALAGLKTGDVITSLRGRALSSDADVVAAIQDLTVHETVRILYLRRNRVSVAEVTVAEVPKPPAPTEAIELGGAILAEFGPASDAAARSGQATGVMFAKVPKGSGAEKAGVQHGDVLIVFGMDAIATLDDLRVLMDRTEGADAFRLHVRRGEKTLTLIVPRS